MADADRGDAGEEEGVAMEYSDVHRALVQAFMAHRVLTASAAKPILAAILSAADQTREYAPEDIPTSLLSAYIGACNERLVALDLEIRSTRSQTDRAALFALVNTSPDALSQAATTHTADEIAFLRRVLDACFDTNNTRRAEVFAVSAMDAVRLHKNPPREEEDAGEREAEHDDDDAVDSDGAGGGGAAGHAHRRTGGLSMKEAEAALYRFVDEGWLARSRSSWYSLAPRGLMELSGYLRATYDDDHHHDASSTHSSASTHSDDGDDAPRIRIRFCHACKEIVTVGERCDDLDCPARLHEPCAVQFFRVHRDRQCPRCRRDWSGREKVGEAAARKLRRRVSRVSGVVDGGGEGRRRRRSGREEVEVEQEGESGVEVEAEEGRRRGNKRRRRTPESVDDVGEEAEVEEA